jgi:hypothetical protein
MTDTNFEGFTKSVSDLQKKMPELEQGTGSAAATLRKLGVSVKGTDGQVRNMDELFPSIIEKLQGVENVTQRNAMAFDLFGKGSKDLAPLLKMNAADLGRMKKEANDLGVVMSGELLAATGDYGDEVKKLELQFGGLWRGLAAQLIPTMRDVFLPIIRETIIPAIQGAARGVENFAKWFRSLDESTQKNVVRFAALAAILPVIILGFGKAILMVKAITTAFTLARVAVMAFSASMATNPFTAIILGAGIVVAALLGAKNAYDNLKKSSQEYTIATVDQAKRMEVAAGWDALSARIQAVAGGMKSLNELSPELTDELDKQTEAARDLGYSIEGDNDAKAVALNTIAMEIKGVRTVTGELVKYTKEKKTAAKVTAQATEEEIAFRAEWVRKSVESNARLIKSDELKLESDIRLNQMSRESAVKAAEAKGMSTTLINAFYDQEKINLVNEFNRKVVDRERELKNRLLSVQTEYQIESTENQSRRLYLQLTAIEAAKNEEIRKATEAGQSTAGIVAIYEMEKDRTRQQYAKAEEDLQKNLDARLIQQGGNKFAALKFAREQELKAAEGNGEAILKINKYYDQEIIKSKVDLVGQIASIFGQIGSQISNLFAMASANRIQEIDNWETREVRAIEKTTASQAEKTKKIEAINRQAEEKRRAEKTKAAKAQKAADIFAAIMGTAVAVVQALGSVPWPFNMILAGIVGALGAAQVALISAQPIPEFAAGGVVQASPGGMIGRLGEAGQDELVLPMKTGVRAIVDDFINRIGGMAEMFPQSVLAGSGVGRSAGNPGITHVWHIGTLVADDRGIKELERRQASFRIQETQRKGG